MKPRHLRWPNTGRVPRGSRWDEPRSEAAAAPAGIPMTGVEGVAGPGKNPPRAGAPDGKPAEPPAKDEGKLSANSGVSPHSAGTAPDAKVAARKGDEKPPENT